MHYFLLFLFTEELLLPVEEMAQENIFVVP